MTPKKPRAGANLLRRAFYSKHRSAAASFRIVHFTEVMAQPQRGHSELRLDAQVVPQLEQVQQP